MTLESKILLQYDKLYGNMDIQRTIDLVGFLSQHVDVSQFDNLIATNLAEALLSPVAWIRKRAAIVGDKYENNG